MINDKQQQECKNLQICKVHWQFFMYLFKLKFKNCQNKVKDRYQKAKTLEITFKTFRILLLKSINIICLQLVVQ